LKISLKILFILHFPPPVHGSAVVGSLIKGSGLINSSFDCRYINLGTSVSVTDIGRNSFSKLIRYFYLIWQTKWQLITFRPDLCYISPTAKGIGFYKDALIIAIVKLFRRKIIFHYHNKGVSTKQERFFDNMFYRMVFRNTDVILLSKHLYSDIMKYVPEHRVNYCANGIPDSEKTQEADYKTQYKPSLPRLVDPSRPAELLFLSHLIRSKGVLVLIEACGFLKEKGIAFHCTIAGGDSELNREEVEALVIDRSLSSDIIVTGPQDGDSKAQLMVSSDIFVHPSFYDCLPLVLLEAMQNSLPIVSTFEGAIPDVVDDGVTGFLVPQRDAAALAEKLEILIKDPVLRESMGVAGRVKYEREFTLERFEKRMVEILIEVGRKK